MEPADFNHRQDQNNNVHNAMGQDCAKEELGLVDGTATMNRLVPEVRGGKTLKGHHECAKDYPHDRYDKHGLDWNSNRRMFE